MDLRAGGTWMGITRQGRFAAVTNYRETASVPEQAISRGELCKGFLNSNVSAETYLAAIDQQKQRYAGFSLLVGDYQQLFYYGNRQGKIIPIAAGVHGLSNGQLNEPWPKVEMGKLALANKLTTELTASSLLPILLNDETYPDQQLPQTGIDIDRERMLSSRFIRSAEYGTRNASILLSNAQYSQLLIQEFYPQGKSGKQQLTEIMHQ
nr:NRDE family protein [Oceanicoccus sp. KOV_DT_Chl]